MSFESDMLFAAQAKKKTTTPEQSTEAELRRKIDALKEAARSATTEEELDAIQAKMMQLVGEYEATSARTGEGEKVSESKIEKGEPRTFTGWTGNSVESTGKQEKFGLHVGQKLRLTPDGVKSCQIMGLQGNTLVVVGFTSKEYVIVQIDDNLVTADPIDSFRQYYKSIP